MKRITWLFYLLPTLVLADVPVPPAASVAEVLAGTVKTKYVSPATLAGAGIGGATAYRLGAVAGEGRLPTLTYAPNTTVQSIETWRADVNITNPIAILANFYGTTEAGVGANSTEAIAIEYPVGSTNRFVLLMGGQPTGVVTNGSWRPTDNNPMYPGGTNCITAGSYFVTHFWATNANGIVYNPQRNTNWDMCLAGGSLTNNTWDYTKTVTSNPTTDNTMAGAVGIVGSVPSTMITYGDVGDSRDVGVGDVMRGQLFIGLNAILEPFYPMINLSIQGETLGNFQTYHTNRLSIFNAYCNAGVSDLGINDWQPGGNGSHLLTWVPRFCALFNAPMTMETLSPETTSGDNWATVGLQTNVNASDVTWTNYNYQLVQGTVTNVASFIDIAAKTTYGLVWSEPGIPVVSDGIHAAYYNLFSGDPIKTTQGISSKGGNLPGNLNVLGTVTFATITGNGGGLTGVVISIINNPNVSYIGEINLPFLTRSLEAAAGQSRLVPLIFMGDSNLAGNQATSATNNVPEQIFANLPNHAGRGYIGCIEPFTNNWDYAVGGWYYPLYKGVGGLFFNDTYLFTGGMIIGTQAGDTACLTNVYGTNLLLRMTEVYEPVNVYVSVDGSLTTNVMVLPGNGSQNTVSQNFNLGAAGYHYVTLNCSNSVNNDQAFVLEAVVTYATNGFVLFNEGIPGHQIGFGGNLPYRDNLLLDSNAIPILYTMQNEFLNSMPTNTFLANLKLLTSYATNALGDSPPFLMTQPIGFEYYDYPTTGYCAKSCYNDQTRLVASLYGYPLLDFGGVPGVGACPTNLVQTDYYNAGLSVTVGSHFNNAGQGFTARYLLRSVFNNVIFYR